MRPRSLITSPLKWALAQAGWDVISRTRYGYDPYLDIKRLNQAWGYQPRLFFDVGANEGSTVQTARAAFPSCRIVAFEPHPKTFLKLKEKTRGVENVDLVNIALGSEAGETTMFEYEHSTINSLISNTPYAVRFKNKSSEIRVKCTTLDAFCAENGIAKIDVLKVDTEGFDFHVLRGAQSMLESNCVNFVYFEFNNIHAQKGGLGQSTA